MGNRAHVIFRGKDGSCSPAVYLHWNGGPESVYAFLDELKARKGFCHSPEYSAARFVGIVADFFGPEDGHSLGIVDGPGQINDFNHSSASDVGDVYDHGDNGVYIVNMDGEMQARLNGGKWADAKAIAQEERMARKSEYFTDPDGTLPERLAELRELITEKKQPA